MSATESLPNKIVVLLSGGLDSALCLKLAKEETRYVNALIFNYQQKHVKEVTSAIALCKFYNIDYEVVDLDLPLKSSLMKSSSESVMKRVNYVPFRNTIFLSIASGYAESIGANMIYYGANEVDSPDYPDCRPIYIDAMNDILLLHSSNIRIDAPLMGMQKGQIVSMAFGRNIPFELTWSCHRGGEKSCGRCPGCLNRLRGFNEAMKPDPLEYSLVD